MGRQFIPVNFKLPERVISRGFVLEKIGEKNTGEDYAAVMGSKELIRKLRWGSWPPDDWSLEDDRLDLVWHQREFEMRCSFTYKVLDEKSGDYVGCVYIMPPNKPWLKTPKGYDVDVSMWVTQEAYEAELYSKLFSLVKDWTENDWPFEKPYFSNREVPDIE